VFELERLPKQLDLVVPNLAGFDMELARYALLTQRHKLAKVARAIAAPCVANYNAQK
jgi:hypothetical protein